MQYIFNELCWNLNFLTTNREMIKVRGTDRYHFMKQNFTYELNLYPKGYKTPPNSPGYQHNSLIQPHSLLKLEL